MTPSASATPRVTPVQVLTATGLSVALTAVRLVLLPHALYAGGDAAHYLNMALEPKARPKRRTPSGS
ncbi:hypothetical protein AB0H83_32110 [Dactylosporangium sp. NPDC050688]|uniref:hypothetical protein n=1 Tax=Dactylosporangium sp. NPDC050688 TaxID=3157217 RepID=UPI003401DB8C